MKEHTVEEFVESFGNHLHNGYDVFAKKALKDYITAPHHSHKDEVEQARKKAYKDGARDVSDYVVSELMGTSQSLRDRITQFTQGKISTTNTHSSNNPT